MPLKYVTPIAFLALLPLGGWLGGAWTFTAAVATPLCLAALDGVLGDDTAPPEQVDKAAAPWWPRVYIFLQLAVSVCAVDYVTRSTTSMVEAAGLAVSTGFMTGVFGFVAAHELIHSRNWYDRTIGLLLLASVFYMHFRIAHVYGHHRRAATFADPASARLGESLYAFLPRSVSGQFREAWAFEARRKKRAGRSVISSGNRMIVYLTIETAFLLTVALASIRAVAFLTCVAIIAVALLESFNYVAHYGLTRKAGANGRMEPLARQHTWNTDRRMNNAALFNMGRHSDHHRRTTLSYPRLESLAGAAVLPSGYAAALLTALVPPLWRRVMDWRAEEAMGNSDDDEANGALAQCEPCGQSCRHSSRLQR